MSFKISRRLIPAPAPLFSALAGKSFSRKLRYSFVSASSPMLCQKRSPPSRESLSRAASRSSAMFGLSFELIVFFAPLSSVTHRAIRKALNLVLLHQLSSQLELVRRRLVIWVKHFRFRPHIFLGLAVAFEAPRHVQRARAPCDRHFGNGPVARGATNSLAHMNAVVEVYKVRQSIHACPGDRLVIAIAGAHRLEHCRIRPDLRMAGHAYLRRRNTRARRFLHGRGAMTAIDSRCAGVMLATDRDRLVARDVLARVPRRPLDLIQRRAEQAENKPTTVEAEPRNQMRVVMKYL